MFWISTFVVFGISTLAGPPAAGTANRHMAAREAQPVDLFASEELAAREHIDIG